MYNHQLRVYGEYLAKEQPLPLNTKIVGNGGYHHAGGQLGASEIIITANTVVTLTANKSLTLTIETSSDGVTFATMPANFKLIAGGVQKRWEAGEVIGRMPLPSDCERYIRVALATDDVSATGKVDITFGYLPR